MSPVSGTYNDRGPCAPPAWTTQIPTPVISPRLYTPPREGSVLDDGILAFDSDSGANNITNS
jgi:hypothetical protein